MLNANTLRRSQLGIPANESQLVAEGIPAAADELFLDLEDSLAPGEKIKARDKLIDMVQSHDWTNHVLSYRINGTETRWWYDDIIEVVSVVGETLDTIIIPKVQDANDVHTVETLLRSVETNAGLENYSLSLSAQIETAAGMDSVTQIAHSSERLDALIFGPADYAASIGASHGATDYPGHYWHYPLSRVSQAAGSAGLLAIGGPHTKTHDSQELTEACNAERTLGFDGKIVIHPNQIETVNRIFSPTADEAARARRIVQNYKNSGQDEIATIDGKIIDQEMYQMAKRIMAKAEKSGN